MNYVITGSIGHISKPLVHRLVAAGNAVSVITSNSERIASIEALGATALVGSVEDVAFVTESFAGADALYLMIPPKWDVADWYSYQQQVANNYVAAVKANNIKNVVVLSSIGAHMRQGAGPIDGLAYLEVQLIDAGVNAVFLRPSYFFYNLFAQIDLVKNAGVFGSNFGGDEKLVLVDTNDIAAVAAEVLLALPLARGQQIRYISSDEATTQEIATALGKAIGKEGTPWVVFTDEQAYAGLKQAGLPDTIAQGYTTLGKALRSGELQADYWANRPTTQGSVKLAQFAQVFAAAYQSK
ncbi:MAG: NAD(P)H-binding protein [Chitinophagaceae bacterium]